MDDLIKQIEKLKYQMSLVGESLSFDEHPIASLVISMNWDDDDLNRAHDIFEKYDDMLDNGEEPNWYQFEADFKEKFGIGYQTLKMIILAFYKNYQWTSVCIEYAKSHMCMEFHSITQESGL